MPPSQLGLLPNFVRNTAQPRLLYVLKAWAVSLAGSVLLSLVISGLSETPPSPEFPQEGGSLLFWLVLFAPIVETFIMVPPLLVLDRLVGPLWAIAGSALGWGIVHSLAEPGWGLVIWWPFTIFSTVLLVWRPHGLAKAILMVITIHALQNAVPALALLADRGVV